MPIISIETWPLKKEQKPILMKEITEVFVKQGIPAQAITILIHETELENWASAGEQHSIKFKDLKR